MPDQVVPPPITASDEEIAAALEEASVPALVLSMIHMNGDASVLDGPIRPGHPELLEIQGGLDERDQTALRAKAVDAVRAYRDAGSKPAAPPTQELAERMMGFAVGQAPFPQAYAPMLHEELALDGGDPRRVDIDAAKLAARPDFHVVVIGAGMSGLLAAIRLKQAGVPFTVLEKNPEVGGTWYENRYPGCRVDIASYFYSYSFEHSYDWNEYFGQHDELLRYFQGIARKYGVLEHIRFGVSVSSAEYDEAAQHWRVEFQGAGAQAPEVLDASLVVSAVGQLNRPKVPDVEGRESFAGPQMHTAEWDPNVDLAGKRVAVVGSGASAFQLVPELAKTAASLKVFQRTPQWMFPNPGYHDDISDGHRWCLRHLPGYERWFRFIIFWTMADHAEPRIQIDPDWDDGGLSSCAANKAMRDGLVAYISSQVQDAGLLEKVIPQYPPFGTRTLQDNGSWLAALQRPNVELVAESVTRVSENSVTAADGSEHEVDAIVWATGFQADKFLWPMEVVGRGGIRLAELWSEGPRAYLGITVPRFPNLFCLYGPNTNVAHTGCVIFISECQVNYLMSALKQLLEGELGSLDCKEPVAAAYEEKLSERLARCVWSHPSVKSFYRGSSGSGRVVVNMPWSIRDYWKWTREADLADYETRS